MLGLWLFAEGFGPGAQLMIVLAVTLPFSSASAAVKGFIVEPGS